MELRGNRYGAILTAALVFGLGGTACGSEATCESPFQVSELYPGGTNPGGLEIDTQFTQDAKQVEVGFTDPGDNWHDQWLPPDQASKIAMSIGSGAVRFRTRIKAVDGSAICKARPDTRFKVRPYAEILNEGGVAPDASKFRLDQRR